MVIGLACAPSGLTAILKPPPDAAFSRSHSSSDHNISTMPSTTLKFDDGADQF